MASSIWDSIASLRNALAWTPHTTSNCTETGPQRIKLPDILSLIPEITENFEVNPHCAWVSERSLEWSMQYELQTALPVEENSNAPKNMNEPALRHNIGEHQGNSSVPDLKPGLLAALCFPSLDPTPLLLCTDLLNLLLLLQVRLVLLSPDDSQRLVTNLINAADDSNAQSDQGSTGFLGALHHILSRLKRSQPDFSLTTRLQELTKGTLNGFINANRESRPNLNAYLSEQRRDGWPLIFFLLLQSGLGLPQNIRSAHYSLAHMESIAAEAMTCASDIYRRVSRTYHSAIPRARNAVHVLQHSRALGLQEAIEQVGELCSSRLRDLVSHQKSVVRDCSCASTDPEAKTKADAILYARALVHCVTGLFFWAFETEWYFGVDAPHLRLTMSIDVNEGYPTM